jgi:arylsulfatase A-like enzyme
MKAIVLIARGLQHGALGCYGNQWIDTPALDALAAGGVVFDQHFASTADADGARHAWRTGRYHLPTAQPRSDTTTAPDLLAVLRQCGIHTCLIVDDSRPAPPAFSSGWDEVHRVVVAEEATPLEATLEATGAALERLEHRDNWLVWIDLAMPLPPWDVPEEFWHPYFSEEMDGDEEEDVASEFEDEEAEEESEPLTPMPDAPAGPIHPEDDPLYLSLQTSYAAAVTYLDAGIGQLLDALANLEGSDELLLVVSSDVGQNLGEHGVVGPVRAWLHDEILHLPLLLRQPGGAGGGRRVAALTQAVDLGPTLADWFQTTLPDAHGHSLLPLARGEAETIRPYVCAGLQVGAAIEYALRTPDWAFLLPVQPGEENAGRAPQLYVKPDDRWEVNNVLQHHLEFAEQLERTLRDFVTASTQPGPLRAPPLPDVEGVAEVVPSTPPPSET